MVLINNCFYLVSAQTKRKRGLLTSSTLPEVSPNTYNNHIRVKAHAIGVSIRAFTLDCYFYFGEISGNKILSGRFFYMSIV